MPFILNEDKALKSLLGGIQVADAKNANRPVGVFFGQPDVEIRDQKYPYVTIDLIDISEDPARNNRGIARLPYTPEGYDPEMTYYTELPIPVNIDYQVTSYVRQPLHDRQIMSALLTDILPFRYGTLEIPEDGTLRRVELLGYMKRDMTEQGKRLFVNVFSIRVSSEIFSSTLVDENGKVLTVSLNNTPFYNTEVTIPVQQ